MSRISDGATCTDKLELYRIEDGEWIKEVETNNTPSVLQRALMKLGLYNCAGDAMTNYALHDLALYTSTKYVYASVGTTGTNGTNYTYDDLLYPVMTRFTATPALVNTYSTEPTTHPDTVQYTIIATSDGDYTLAEAGLHTTLTGGNMGSRQVFGSWSVTTGETFGMIWKIIYGRG
jgi:hypothetical protein